MTQEFDPRHIVEVLDRHGVLYVLIGGYAAQLYGARRPTNDSDIAPSNQLESQLPVGSAVLGIPWCKQDYYAPTRMLTWVWGEVGTPRLAVEIDPSVEDPSRAVVFLTFYGICDLDCVS